MKLLKQLLEALDAKEINRIYNTQMSYTDKDGKNKRIKVSSALTYGKDHPAYKTALKFLKSYDVKPPKNISKTKAKGETPKTTSTKKEKTPTKSKIDFKSSAEKRKPSPKQDTTVYKKMIAREKTPDDIRDAIVNKASLSDSSIGSIVKKQSEYWNNAVKDKGFSESVVDWRDVGIPKGRMDIDKYIQKNPPPPLKMKSGVWRGMGMSKDGYNKFMKMIQSKSEIKLPASSFSFDPQVAVEFADQDRQVIINLKSECNELNAIALSDVPGQDSVYSEKEKEVITPSNAKYKVESIKEVEFEWSPDVISMVTLIQKCGMNEAEESVADFSKDEFMDSLFGPTQK